MNRILFHGTTQNIQKFNEDSIGIGGDPNSALGVHGTDDPFYAYEYATLAATLCNKNGFIYVLSYKYTQSESISCYESFYGCEDDNTNNHRHFSELRQDYLENDIQLIDFEGSDSISTMLNPNNISILFKLSLSQAIELQKKYENDNINWNENGKILNAIKDILNK